MSPSHAHERVSLWRAWVILLIALCVSLVAGFIAAVHDGWIAHTEISQQNYIAPLVVVLLLGPVLVVNALLCKLSRGLRWGNRRCQLGLHGAEIALIVCLALAASPLTRSGAWAWVSTVGHTHALLDARHASMSKLSKANPYDRIPADAMLSLDDSREFDQGLSSGFSGVSLVSPLSVPWFKWFWPAMRWLPLLACFIMLATCLGVVLQSHWANRELLAFPLAQLTSPLIPTPGRSWPVIFRSPVFWAGFTLAGVIFLVNGLHAHFEKMIEIPTAFNYYALSQQFSFLKNSLEGYSLLRGTVFFAVIAVAVLLPSEISFSTWFFWPIMVVASYFHYTQTGQRYTGYDNSVVMLGASLGMAILILHSGRGFYIPLLRQALFLGGDLTATGRRERFYARLGIASAAGVAAGLIAWGLPWDLAIIWTLASILFMVIVARLTAEMGLYWTPLIGLGPMASLLTLFGDTGLGVHAYALIAVVSSVLLPSASSMVLVTPAVAHGLEVERQAGRPSLSIGVIGPFLLLAFALGIVMHIWLGYSVGGQDNDYYSVSGISQVNDAARFAGLSGVREEDASTLSRWSLSQMKPGTLGLLGFGATLVIVVGVMRLRFPRFPFHPLPLVVMGSWVLSRFWLSFFIGWLIKKMILLIGGRHLFDQTRPFFVGLLAGQCVLLGFWVLVNIGLFCTNGGIADAMWWRFMAAIFSF